MRIGMITSFPPIECGIASYSDYLVDALRQRKNDVYVVSHLGGAGRQVFPVFNYEDEDLARKAFSTMGRFSPDVVHVQHEFGLYGKDFGMQVVPMLLLFRLNGFPVVVTLHTVYPEMPPQQRIILENIMANADRVIVHEALQKETLINQRIAGNPDAVFVIPHGAREIDPVPDAKKRLGLPENAKIILLIGYLRPSKNFEDIIEILPQIAGKVKDSYLVLAGKVRGYEYRDYRRMLYQMIASSPVKDRIRVIRGQLKQDTFDIIISAADVVVLPYKITAQSGILAHSLAFGRPVVASDSGTLPDVLSRADCGIVCRSRDDYVDAIVRVLLDKDLARKFSKNARAFVRNEISWRIIAQRHEDIYRDLVSNNIEDIPVMWVE